MESLTPLVLIAVICLVVGLIIGILVSSLREDKEPPDANGRDPKLGPDWEEAARLWRHSRTNQVALEVDGETFQRAEDMTVKHFNYLARVTGELGQWLGSPGADEEKLLFVPPPVAPPSAGPPGLSQEQPPVQSTNEPERPGQPQEQAPIELTEQSKRQSLNQQQPPIELTSQQLAELEAAVEESKPSGRGASNLLQRVFRRGSKTDRPPSSIAAQIDEILQKRLESSTLDERAIRIMELPGKGLVVLVGLEQYDGVDSIPYPEVRELIQDCVAEWEQRVDKDVRRYQV